MKRSGKSEREQLGDVGGRGSFLIIVKAMGCGIGGYGARRVAFANKALSLFP